MIKEIQYLCNFNELKKKHYIIKFIENWKEEIIIFFDITENKVKIFSSICPHFGGEIYYDINEKLMKCKWHGWKFCTKTGKCLSYPIIGSLNPYEFDINPNNLQKYQSKIENDKIYVVKRNEE